MANDKRKPKEKKAGSHRKKAVEKRTGNRDQAEKKLSTRKGAGGEGLIPAVRSSQFVVRSSSSRDELSYWLAFLFVKKLGPARARKFIEHYRDPQWLFELSAAELKALDFLAKDVVANILAFDNWAAVDTQRALMDKHQVTVLPFTHPNYPARLNETENAPALLFCRGTLTKADEKAVAIVGTRTPTSSGRQAAESLAGGLAEQGVTVVSGLARGIDSCAHQAALKKGGRTVAVLGCSVDIVYPPENDKLMESIVKQGAVISEYPLGTQPDALLFPRRNKIISGLSLGVVVVEAPDKSGALITAEYAREQGRKVFAVPGSILSQVSRGTNKLLKEGAGFVTNADDILAGLGFKPAVMQRKVAPTVLPPGLSAQDTAIVNTLTHEPMHIDALAGRVQLPTAKLLGILLGLEIKGLVVQTPGMRFARHTP